MNTHFIKLTTLQNQAIYVNMSFVVDFKGNMGFTSLYILNSDYRFVNSELKVKETVEYILSKIICN